MRYPEPFKKSRRGGLTGVGGGVEWSVLVRRLVESRAEWEEVQGGGRVRCW